MSLALQKRLLAELEADRPCALATIVEAKGSVPNDVGAMMLIDYDGNLLEGTVGGGEIERFAIAQCKEALEKDAHRKIEVSLTEGGLGMACGGKAEIYIHVYGARLQLVLFGGGHVNVELSRFADRFGFAVTVVDERPDWCNETLYPMARRLQMPIADAVELIPWTDRTYVMVATPSHRYDEQALRAIAERRYQYVGLVASKRKALQIVDSLKNSDIDISQLLPRLSTPVGLDLGGRGPADVALSVIAEIQAVRYGRTGKRMGILREAE
jgi:xanthine dehydrogenase accessory factor